MNPNEQTELERAIDEGEFLLSKGMFVRGALKEIPHRTLKMLTIAARRAQEAERERDCWIYNANELQKGYNKLDKQLSSAQEALKLAAEALSFIKEECDWENSDERIGASCVKALSHPAIQAILGKGGDVK